MDSTTKNAFSCRSELAPDFFAVSGPQGKSKILLIDDEPVNTELLEAILANHGYVNVKSINDSRIVIHGCNSFLADLILLDVMMPHFDGIAVLQAIRSEPNNANLPVVVITADETDETRLRAFDAGATDFMLKPFHLTEILLRISNLLAFRGPPAP